MATLSAPGTSPTVFETFATTGEYPTARSVGNVISEPDPTTVLMVPAARPAARIAIASNGLMGGRPWSRLRRSAVSGSPARFEASASAGQGAPRRRALPGTGIRGAGG